MNIRAGGEAWAVGLAVWILAGNARTAESPCQDPVFIQFEARVADRGTAREQIQLWQEFLTTYPGNPCAGEAREQLARLESGQQHAVEETERQNWQHEAHGGVIEPDIEVFGDFLTLNDPAPRNRLRLLNEVGFLTDTASFHNATDSPLWLQVLRLEGAPANHFGFSVDLPLVAATEKAEGFGYGLGNLTLGLRGLWGMRFSGDLPFMISGGFWYSPGSSGWLASQHTKQLDAAAYAAAYQYQFYRINQADYAFHLESEIGAGSNFVVLALGYHILAQADTVYSDPKSKIIDKLFRWDLGWQLRLREWIAPTLEVNGGIGISKAENYVFLYLTPGLRFRYGHFSAGLALHWALLDSSQQTPLLLSIELAAQL